MLKKVIRETKLLSSIIDNNKTLNLVTKQFSKILNWDTHEYLTKINEVENKALIYRCYIFKDYN